MRRALATVCSALLGGLSLLLLGGCETVGYYAQAAGGQLELLYRRQPVDEVLTGLEGRELSEEELRLKRQLELSQAMLAFAESEIGLPVEGRYRTYVELSGSSVVWNLFAAPELSLEARMWCYPFVGCAPYRGYFEREAAERYRDKLHDEGFETYIGGVAAYSTLGWFDDPLLSSFISWPEASLAELLFHELAHSRVWIKGDVEFNEAFASFVGRAAMQVWLERQGRIQLLDQYLDSRRERARFSALLREVRDALAELYASGLNESDKRDRKRAVIARALDCFHEKPESYGDRYAGVLARLNNALLVSVSTYEDRQPVFAALFEEAGDDWPGFFAAVERLAALDAEARALEVERLSEHQVADARDDEGAEHVECKSLASHGLDGEASG